MFSEILKIIPKLDGAALQAMERSLSKRFTNIAKKFGSGLKAAILGGGITALALGVIDKLLNPLKEVKENLDKILNKTDDLNTFSEQFGTTPGKLLNLQTVAQAKGLAPEELRTLLVKFQGALTEAKADPSKPSSVRNFIDIPDTADAFFEFIQSLQKLTAAQQDFVQREVFGEKQILKASEFLKTSDFPELVKRLQLINPEISNPILKRGGQISDKRDEMRATLESHSLVGGAMKLQPGMVTAMDVQDRMQAQKEVDRLDSFNKLATMQTSMDKISNTFEKGFLDLLTQFPIIVNSLVNLGNLVSGSSATGKAIREEVSAIAKSRLIRGAGGKGDK